MLYLVSGIHVIQTVCVGLLTLFLFCAVPQASRHIWVLFAAGVATALWSIFANGDGAPVRRGLDAGIVVGAFFPTILLLRATADQSELIGNTRERIERLDERQQQTWVQAVSHLLGSFLMVGGYVIARAALPREIPEAQRVRLAQGGVRGLCLSACWSPFFLAPAIASQLVPTVKAWQLVAIGVPFAAMGLLLTKLLFYRGTAVMASVRSVAAFAIPSAVLVSIVIAVSVTWHLKNLEAIVLVMPVLCLAYLATRGGAATRRALSRVPSALGRLADEVIVFTTSITIGAVVGGSGAGKVLATLIAGIAGMPSLLIAAESVLIAALGYLGVHPMITSTLMIPLLAEAHRQGVADLIVAYIQVFGWVLSSMIAIWQLPVATAATTFGVSVRRLTFGSNMGFVLAFGVCGCIALASINRILF